MNNIMVMRTINNTNNLDGPETYIVNENFKVVRKSKFNDKNIEVFTDELFNNGVSVLVSYSMETSPTEIYNKYLKIQKENNEYQEAQKAYKESAYDEKCDYWKNYAQKTTAYSERFGGSSIINISGLRGKEPEINLFIDEMILSTSKLFAIKYEEALTEYFEIDEAGKPFIRNSYIEGVDIEFTELVERIGNLFYDGLGSFLNVFGDNLNAEANSKQKIGEKISSEKFQNMSQNINQASQHIMTAWEICKPYISEGFPKLKHTSEIKGINISNSELANRISRLTYEKMTEFLTLLALKIKNDGLNDESKGRKKLSAELFKSAENISMASKILSDL